MLANWWVVNLFWPSHLVALPYLGNVTKALHLTPSCYTMAAKRMACMGGNITPSPSTNEGWYKRHTLRAGAIHHQPRDRRDFYSSLTWHRKSLHRASSTRIAKHVVTWSCHTPSCVCDSSHTLRTRRCVWRQQSVDSVVDIAETLWFYLFVLDFHVSISTSRWLSYANSLQLAAPSWSVTNTTVTAMLWLRVLCPLSWKT